MPDATLLGRFMDVRRSGAGWMAKCPAHDDRTASLSIGRGDRQPWVLCCQAGCTQEAVVAAAGLTMADLLQPRNGNGSHRIVAEYHYHDEGGAHLFDVVRYEPKDFRQRRADGVWKMAGVRRVLYRLDTLQGKTTAYVVEGEKDADRLAGLKLPATTNAGGASAKWLNEYNAQLTGAGIDHVVILPDNDEAGHKHAEDVARSCHGAGLQVKVVDLHDLPAKGDISDWLDAGHTKAEFAAIVKGTPLYVPETTTATIADTTDPHTGLHLTSIGGFLAEPDDAYECTWKAASPRGAPT